MSGHNRWSKIKRQKAAMGNTKGKLFSKVIKEITLAAKLGGGDPANNNRLRVAISAAKAANIPGDSIQRAVKKGTGELEGAAYEEIVYEGYGPGGVAVVRTAPNDLHQVASALEAAGLPVSEQKWLYLPENTVRLEGDNARKMLKLMELLEDNDDVQEVHANFEIDEALMQELAG
ncbi:MAG: YebC/PmpR family DNA-binding transcriptional regulator [Myxococcota bacterium]|nr:YebC/PmpR family DNA-binding transcriptional regulator [Myxococcota bacterium]